MLECLYRRFIGLSLSLCVQQTFSVWIYLLHIFCCFDKHSLPYQIYFWPKCCCTRRLNCILWYDRPFACIHINIRSTADKRTPCKMMRISGYAIAATMFWLQYYLYEMCTLYSHTHHMGYSIYNSLSIRKHRLTDQCTRGTVVLRSSSQYSPIIS